MAGRLPVVIEAVTSIHVSSQLRKAFSMNYQQGRTLQETSTTASPAEVIDAAKAFFAQTSGIYSAFLEKEGPGYATFRGQGGEELVIGTAAANGLTRVSGSTYLFDQQVARFLASLPTPASVAGADVQPLAGASAT